VHNIDTASGFSTIPASAIESSPADSVAIGIAAPLLQQLSELPADATGSLLFGPDGQSGAVLVEGGRICWAISPRMRRRLTDLLCHQRNPPLDRASVEDVIRTCRHDHKPFGEALVKAGIATEVGLRRALRQHNAESIALLANHGIGLDGARWLPHKNHRYDARFTFSAMELLTTLGALNDVEMAARARDWLKYAVAGNGIGIAFSRSSDGRSLVPVGEIAGERLPLEELEELSEWTRTTLQVCSCLSDNPVIASTWNGGLSSIVWQHGELSFAMLFSASGDWARSLGRVQRLLEDADGAVSRGAPPDPPSASGERPRRKTTLRSA